MQRHNKLFIVGPMGVGKTTIGKALAKELNLTFYDVDLLIEERCGADIAWIYDIEGPDGFRKREEAIIEEYTQKSEIVLSTGSEAVLSQLNRQNLSSRGIVVYLEASIAHLINRTLHDKRRPLLQQTENKGEVIEKTLLERQPFYEAVADIHVLTDERSIATIVQQIVKGLATL